MSNKIHEEITAAAHKKDGTRDTTNYSTGMTDDEVVALLVDQVGNRKKENAAERLRTRWVRSAEFVPMILPTAILYPVRIPSGRTESFTTGPLVVEDNFRNVEQTDAGKPNGFFPPYVIIDGQHRWLTALQSGQETMRCLVGVDAVPKVHAALLAWAGAVPKKKKRRYADPA